VASTATGGRCGTARVVGVFLLLVL
jgi:hypothetical protein